MNDKEKGFEAVLTEINKMTEKAKQAVAWMLKNIELLDALCEGEKMTEEEIETCKNRALETEDYIMLIMVLYKQEQDRMVL